MKSLNAGIKLAGMVCLLVSLNVVSPVSLLADASSASSAEEGTKMGPLRFLIALRKAPLRRSAVLLAASHTYCPEVTMRRQRQSGPPVSLVPISFAQSICEAKSRFTFSGDEMIRGASYPRYVSFSEVSAVATLTGLSEK